MSDIRQPAPGERSGSGDDADAPADAVAAIEAALGSLRRGARFGPPGAGGPFGPGGPFGGGPGPLGGRRGGPHQSHHGHDEHPGYREHPGRGRGGHAAFRLLAALDAHGPQSVTEVAAHIGVDQPRASRLVQSAVDAGHVRREPDPSDARRSILIVTDAGRALLSATVGRRREAIEAALAGFSPAERAEFARLLSRFADGWPQG